MINLTKDEKKAKAIRKEYDNYVGCSGRQVRYIYNCLKCNSEIQQQGTQLNTFDGYCRKCKIFNKVEIDNNKILKNGCKKCKRILPFDRYSTKKGKHGLLRLKRICMDCIHLKYEYGISTEIYENLIKLQDNKCAICNKDEVRKFKTRNTTVRLAVDHCHKTGKIRELLCSKCNAALGAVGDSIDILEKMISYLKKHNN